MKAAWGMLLVAMMACGAPPDRNTPPANPLFSTDGGADAGTSDTKTQTDGGRPDAGPSRNKRVFVTSQTYPPDFSGISANTLRSADALCFHVARGANLDGNFKAWLSSTSVYGKPETVKADAIERIADVGPWVQFDKREQKEIMTFNNKANLISTPLRSIAFDENGVELKATSLVWTGTSALGKATASTCSGFSSQAGYGTVGSVFEKTEWTEARSANCYEKHHLYCFEQ